MSVEKDEKIEPKNPQNKTDQDITSRIWTNFLRWRDNRNLSYSYFRERNCLEYWDDRTTRLSPNGKRTIKPTSPIRPLTPK
jgi:hypothetical protein